jgi:hypothetical protein
LTTSIKNAESLSILKVMPVRRAGNCDPDLKNWSLPDRIPILNTELSTTTAESMNKV